MPKHAYVTRCEACPLCCSCCCCQLEFQNGKTEVAARLAKSVCRRNPNYAGAQGAADGSLHSMQCIFALVPDMLLPVFCFWAT